MIGLDGPIAWQVRMLGIVAPRINALAATFTAHIELKQSHAIGTDLMDESIDIHPIGRRRGAAESVSFAINAGPAVPHRRIIAKCPPIDCGVVGKVAAANPQTWSSAELGQLTKNRPEATRKTSRIRCPYIAGRIVPKLQVVAIPV